MAVPHSIVPCATEEYPTAAKRPHNSILENRNLKAKGINVMPNWREDVARFVDEYRDRLLHELG
jgi:dTDP-4-dehydrorhamnose reductase